MRWFSKLLVILCLPIFVYGCVTDGQYGIGQYGIGQYGIKDSNRSGVTDSRYGIKESNSSGMIVPDRTPPVSHYQQRQTSPPAQPHTQASHQAPSSTPQAPASAYGQVRYVNASKPGPSVVVLPGQVKTTNPEFRQLYSENNIADFAELELTKANFNTLERDDLGPMLEEIKAGGDVGRP